MTKHIYVNSIEEATFEILDNYQDLLEKIKIAMNDMEKPVPAESLAEIFNVNVDKVINAVNKDARMVFLPNGDIWLPITGSKD